MAVDTELLPPRYRSPRRIGHGAMGDIYLATDDTLGREVVVKVLSERYAADEAITERFKREGLAAARLSGESGAVTIFDVGEWEGRPFIVMEHLGGGSLEERLAGEGAQPPARALAWLEQAAATLDSAHRHGVVHRDVKPANLLLDSHDDLHVADFGIASAAGLDSMTLTGTVLGTAGYLSPEQARGERAGPASDLYALAVVAYELLSGQRPFENDSSTAEAVAHVHAPVPSIAALREEPSGRAGRRLPPGAGEGPGGSIRLGLRIRLGAARGSRRLGGDDGAAAAGRPGGIDARRRAAPVPDPGGAAPRSGGRGSFDRRNRHLGRRADDEDGRRPRRHDHRPADGHAGARASATSPASTPTCRGRRERAHPQRPWVPADAAGRLLERVAALPASCSEAAGHGAERSLRGLRELQPRLHALPARPLLGSGHLPSASGAARADRHEPTQIRKRAESAAGTVPRASCMRRGAPSLPEPPGF